MFNTAEKKKTCCSLVKGARKEFIMRGSPTLQPATKAVEGKKSQACRMEKIVKLL
jgi:hypothetical protein